MSVGPFEVYTSEGPTSLDAGLFGAGFANERFVLCGRACYVYGDADGWTTVTMSPDNGSQVAVAGNESGTWVSVGTAGGSPSSGGYGSGSSRYVSTDNGESWSRLANFTSPTGYLGIDAAGATTVAYGDGIFAAITGESALWYATDPTTTGGWTRTSPFLDVLDAEFPALAPFRSSSSTHFAIAFANGAWNVIGSSFSADNDGLATVPPKMYAFRSTGDITGPWILTDTFTPETNVSFVYDETGDAKALGYVEGFGYWYSAALGLWRGGRDEPWTNFTPSGPGYPTRWYHGWGDGVMVAGLTFYPTLNANEPVPFIASQDTDFSIPWYVEESELPASAWSEIFCAPVYGDGMWVVGGQSVQDGGTITNTVWFTQGPGGTGWGLVL